MGSVVSSENHGASEADVIGLRALLTPAPEAILSCCKAVTFEVLRQMVQESEGTPNHRRALYHGCFATFNELICAVISAVGGAPNKPIRDDIQKLEKVAIVAFHMGLGPLDVQKLFLTFLSKAIRIVLLDGGPLSAEWELILATYTTPIMNATTIAAKHAVEPLCAHPTEVLVQMKQQPRMKFLSACTPVRAQGDDFFGLEQRRFLCGYFLDVARDTGGESTNSGDMSVPAMSSESTVYASLRNRYLYLYHVQVGTVTASQIYDTVTRIGPIITAENMIGIIDLGNILAFSKLDEDENDLIGQGDSTNVKASSPPQRNGNSGTSELSTSNLSSTKRPRMFVVLRTPTMIHYLAQPTEHFRDSLWRVISHAVHMHSRFYSPPLKENSIDLIAMAKGLFHYRPLLTDFEFIKFLGAGTFGKVIKVRHRPSGKLFALKIIRKDKFHSIRNVVEVRRERAVLEACDNPYIMKINATLQNETRVYFLLDYLPGGELLRHTQRAPGHHFPESAGRFYIAELAIAVNYLKENHFLHRDIKGDNLVIDEEGHVMLTDFGFAKVMNPSVKNKTCCGTLAYVAPEMLNPNKLNYGVEVDWWSIGVVLFTVLTGYFPFLKNKKNDTVAAIMGHSLQFPSKPPLSVEARDLCTKLMEKKPEKRIASLEAMKAHPFFTGFNWEACEKKRLRSPFMPTDSGGSSNGAKDKDVMADFYEEAKVATLATGNTILKVEDDIFSPFFAAQESAGSDRDDSSSESDTEDESLLYDKLGNSAKYSRADFVESSSMLRPLFSESGGLATPPQVSQVS